MATLVATPAVKEPTRDELIARIAQLEKKASGQNSNGLGIKVSQKGAVSVYGLQRFPVTLYAETWIKLLNQAKDITTFIEANKSSLSFKATKEEQAEAA